MAAQSLPAERFVRRTQLGRDEYRKNFRQLDCEAISVVTSPEADTVTPLMSKIYLRLVNAPEGCWERESVLRFAGEERDGRWITAWEQLVSLAGVASATARKALQWMHCQGIVGYFAGKNGVGIRIFLNRAASSIGQRPAAGEKNLRLVRASNAEPRASANDTPFKDSYADLEVLETDLNPRAPKNGADDTRVGITSCTTQRHHPATFEPADTLKSQGKGTLASADELTVLLLGRLEPAVRTAAAQAAAREHERTREWLESKGLPKAARVAQREAYDVLRRHGLVNANTTPKPAGSQVGSRQYEPEEARPLSVDEVRELAETCVAMLEVHGKSIDVTLAELSAGAGGVLLAEDVPKVRETAEALARDGRKGGQLVV